MNAWARELRAAFFVVVATFVVFGPIRTQVLLKPLRSATHPLRPMAWQMYHGVGVDMCQASFHGADGAPLPRDVVQRAVGPTQQSRHTVVRRVRANDVLFAETELRDISQALCGSRAEVRAHVRCAPKAPGGKWQIVHDGRVNLCATPPAPALTREPAPDPGPSVAD